jgi:hypothetical protein
VEKKNRKYYPLGLFVVSLLFVTIFSRATSFLYAYEGFDAAIFKQMGMALLKDKILYVDYFDNKGCLLYFIQAFGLWLGGNLPILLMQAVSLTITLWIWERILALYLNPKERLIRLVVLLVLLLCFYEGGDLTEEWCLPFASYPILLYFKSLKQNTAIRNGQMFLIGVCFGIIAFIRVNNASPFLGFLAFYWIQQLLKKEFRSFFRTLSLFVLGTFLIVGICIIYFYAKAGWYGVREMVYATFLSNLEYLSLKVNRPLINIVFYVWTIVVLVVWLIHNTKKEKAILIPSLLSILVFIGTFGRLAITHYFMALIPLITVGLTQFRKDQLNRILFILALPFFLFYVSKPMIFVTNDLVLNNEKEKLIYADFQHCLEAVPLEERDSICNYNLFGFGESMLFHEGILQNNRICFSLISKNMSGFWDGNKGNVTPTKWILLSWDYSFEDSDAAYILNYYEETCSFEHNRIYFTKPQMGDTFQVKLYRRRE